MFKGTMTSAPALLQGDNTATSLEVAAEPEKVGSLWYRAQAEARELLMTGPKAQAPSGRAVRKAARRLLKGLRIKGSWRGWPRIKESTHEQ